MKIAGKAPSARGCRPAIEAAAGACRRSRRAGRGAPRSQAVLHHPLPRRRDESTEPLEVHPSEPESYRHGGTSGGPPCVDRETASRSSSAPTTSRVRSRRACRASAGCREHVVGVGAQNCACTRTATDREASRSRPARATPAWGSPSPSRCSRRIPGFDDPRDVVRDGATRRRRKISPAARWLAAFHGPLSMPRSSMRRRKCGTHPRHVRRRPRAGLMTSEHVVVMSADSVSSTGRSP